MLLFSLCSAKLAALEVNDLYQASVIVDSQANKQREQAIKEALQAVFLKVGGNESVLTHEVLKKAKKRASRYVSQYRYQQKDELLSLVVSFNEDKVNQLFEQASLALWGSLRPQVLLWLIDEQGASRSILASDADSPIPASVNDFSTQRGLPIIMPLMDLTDNELVVVSDFWEYIPESIQQASLRYFADTVVVMRVSDSSLISVESAEGSIAAVLNEVTNDNRNSKLETFDDTACGLLCDQKSVEESEQEEEPETPKVLDWRVYTQGALYTQKYQGVNKVELINQGLSDITELIYQSYALLTSTENDFFIEVKNVTSLTSDTQLFNFLTDLSAVKTVTLTQAQGSVRHFKLDLIGSRASFLASLKLNNKLTQKIEPQLGAFTQSNDFNDESDSVVINEGSNAVNNAGSNTDEGDVGSNSLLHYGMKVIVLGEPDTSAIEQAEKNIVNNTQDNTQDNTLNNSDVTLQGNIDTLENKGDINNVVDAVEGVNVKPQAELSTNESLLDIKTKPIIVPSIPVFYWEQG
jgi:hypothetical protein